MAKDPEAPDPPAAELSLAGAVVDKAIEYMTGQKIDEAAIASALLGGALALLSHAMNDEAIVRILNNAIASVQAGELHRDGMRPPP
ncbi:MAG: hypothetical protein WBQ75_03105 [Acetobacteraceae bacterium]